MWQLICPQEAQSAWENSRLGLMKLLIGGYGRHYFLNVNNIQSMIPEGPKNIYIY